ncbi:Cna B-type domain-containing protein [Evansella tamaricis]|uniref:Cna B-type domain-containing protein n=1 Tax=Evansella tamaricis TaxID=2069301 RepID=A0ABS6JCF6_9BACI|nr:Cna B-type domain-containing protein [Evansella tamaricis]MBU9711361.1 Cna B-type domain-containing protein [Evansella tamaricis]
MKRGLSIFLLWLMLFYTMSSSIMPSYAITPDDQPSVIKDVSLIDEEGNIVNYDTPKTDSKVYIQVQWSVSGKDVNEGDTEKFTLPNEVDILEVQNGVLLEDKLNEEVGSFEALMDDTVVLTFNQRIEELEEATGTFSFEVNLSLEEKKGSVEEEVVIEGETDTYEKDNITFLSTTGEQPYPENLLIEVSLKEILEDGNTRDLEPNEEIIVQSPYNDFNLKLNYRFELPNNHTYRDGSIYTIEVPKHFTIPVVIDPEPLVRGDGQVFGSFITEGNKILITFNENVQYESNIIGYISLSSSFDKNYDGPALGEPISIPLSNGETTEFPVRFVPDGSAIEKNGVPNKVYNTDTIEWTIDINKNLQVLEDVVLDDVLTEGDHQYIEGSMRFYQLVMNANGTVVDVIELTEYENTTFPIEFDKIEQAYRIVYETEILDNVGERYRNVATLNGTNMSQVEASASVSVSRGKPLEKGAVAYNNVTQTITWTIKYNYDEKVIPVQSAKLTDKLGNNQVLVGNSFVVEEVDIDSDDGSVIGTTIIPEDAYVIHQTPDGFEFTFEEGIDRAYNITYETTVDERVLDNVLIENTVEDDYNNSTTGQQTIHQGVFIKSHTGNTNYKTKETNWQILINRDEQPMNNMVVIDTLPNGFTPKNIQLTHDGNTWDEGEEYIFEYDNGVMRFEMMEPVTKRVYIRYTTEINFDDVDPSLTTYRNNATLEWEPEGETETYTKSASATFDPDNYTKNNGFKHGSYNALTKEITWQIGLNYNNQSLSNVVLEDIIQGNQNFDISNLRVYEMILTGEVDGYDVGNEVTSDFIINNVTSSNDEPGFEVEFGSINSGYLIEYTTDLNGEQIEATYNNDVNISSDNSDDIHLPASVSISYGGEYTNKQAQQNAFNPRVVNWVVRINYSQSEVNQLSLTDTPSINQTVLTDTIKIFGTTVTENSITKNSTDLLVEGEDYTLTMVEDSEGQESFTIDFLEETINRAYILEYDTYILYAGDGTISNTLHFDAVEIVDNEEDGSFNTNINFSQISGGIEGEVGSLEVVKVDYDDDENTLSGAVFELYDESGAVLLKSGITNEDGKVKFNNLLYANYQLKEAEAPDGYVVGIQDQQTVTINEAVETVTIANKEIKRHVQLTKVDGYDNSPLEGVIFELRRADGTIVDHLNESDLTTDENGQIYIEDLEPNNYYFVELQPKVHYQENEREYSFTIEPLQTDIDQLTIENELIPGTVTITKVDKDRPEDGLSDAIFEISDENNRVVDTVTTGVDGIGVSHDLRPGEYTLKEVAAPFGFNRSEEAEAGIVFTIEKSQETSLKIDTITNEVKTADLEIIKRGEISERLLPGALFELEYVSGDYAHLDFIVQTGTTGVDGRVQFENLKPGTYELRELEAPPGHIKSDPLEIELTLAHVNNNQVVQREVRNSPFAEVRLTKEDADTGYLLEGAIFDVITMEGVEVEGFTGFTTNSDGEIRIGGLPVGDYQLKETNAPYGYNIIDDGITEPFTISETTETEIITIEPVENEIIRGDVTLIKRDGDTEIPLADVTFTLRGEDLLHDGEYGETTHTTNENGEIHVENLRPGKYMFEEVAPLDGYQGQWAVHLGSFEIELNPTETVEVEIENYQLVDFEIVKYWNDTDEETRPDEVTIRVLQNGRFLFEETMTKSNNWNIEITGLDAVDENGEKYTYTIEEPPVDGYILESLTGNSNDGFIIRNVQAMDLTASKIWKDEPGTAQRATVSVDLYRNGVLHRSGEIRESSDWKFVFTDLPIFDEAGNHYYYTIGERSVPGYDMEEIIPTDSGFEITNVRAGETVVSGEKIWLDDDSEDRPEFITVHLLRNGGPIPIDEQEVTADTDWAFSFEGLDEFDDQGVPYSYTVEEDPVEGYETTINGYTITNLRVGEIDVRGEKIWLDDDSEDRPESITVHLFQNGDHIDEQEVTGDANWEFSFSNLAEFDNQGKAYTYRVEEYPVDGYATTIDGYTITNLRVGEIDVRGEKIWLDDDSEVRPESITVHLLQNGDHIDEQEVTGDAKWEFSFLNLAEFDNQGKAYTYTVEEETVEGYETSIDGYTITNLRVGEIDVRGDKIWLDDDSEDRPESITVHLLQDGERMDEQEVNADSNWEFTFANLAEFDHQGKTYIYSVEEELVEGYETTIDGYEITNLRVGTTEVRGEKIWLDDNSEERPASITVYLLQNGEQINEQEVTDDANWQFSFASLVQYDEQGVAYTYTVEEEPIDGYETTIDGYTITNLRVGETEVSGEKTWLDDNSEDRPTAIEVYLLQNGEMVETQQVTVEDEWKYQFTNLAAYDNYGVLYSYTVEEAEVSGYEPIYDGFDITNLRAGITEISGEKIWLDDHSSDRPSLIEVHLIRDGVSYATQKLSESTNWQYSFSELEMFDEQGVAYTYTVEEEPVEGYETSIDGYTITNLRVGEIGISGEKTWLDDNSEKRPDSITVYLLQNGERMDEQEVSANSNWNYTFTGLDQFDDKGGSYVYTVEEEPVEGYDTTIEGFNITNVRAGVTVIEGEKIWKGDTESARPNVIFVDVYQNGIYYATVEVTSASHWEYRLSDLPKYDEEGVLYEYTVEEKVVEGYESTVDGYIITNTMIKQLDEGKAHDKDSLPDTATNLYTKLLIGVVILVTGILVLRLKRRRRKVLDN